MNWRRLLCATGCVVALALTSSVLMASSCAQAGRETGRAANSTSADQQKRRASAASSPDSPPAGNERVGDKSPTPPTTKQATTSLKTIDLSDDQDTPNSSGPDLALYDAVERADLDAVKALIAAKANVNVRKNGWTPLLIAANRAESDKAGDEILRRLLEGGADVKAKTGAHETAIYLAARNGQVEMVRLLLAHRADPNVAVQSSSRSETPLAIVKTRRAEQPKDDRYIEIEKLLKAAQAK